MDAGTLFLNAAVLSRKILVKAEYRIWTRYQQILNIEGLGSGSGEKKNLMGTSLTAGWVVNPPEKQ